MSEEIFSVETTFADVVALAQGYMNRADGERLLLPLAASCPSGGGVRFVVYLADGTPAFAGAGLCDQVSDQGSTVPPAQRFETLLNTLQFDERSRPVYDYIVAVRNAAYAQPEAQAPTDPQREVQGTQAEGYEEATSLLATLPPHGTHSDVPNAFSSRPPEGGEGLEIGVDLSPGQELDASPMREPSFVPPPIPTGLLTRPGRATHWQPSPPRRPTPRPASGLFRYGKGSLPRPARPPRPDLDPAYWVQPAPKP
jgi:hypothetical protein